MELLQKGPSINPTQRRKIKTVPSPAAGFVHIGVGLIFSRTKCNWESLVHDSRVQDPSRVCTCQERRSLHLCGVRGHQKVFCLGKYVGLALRGYNVICYIVADQCISPHSGPYWTHILFTWTKADGLKVYINGTFTTGDTTGSNVSENYGDPYPDLLIGTGNNKAYGHYVTGAFDEFVIWERALSSKEIFLYYSAATGTRTTHPHNSCCEEKLLKTTFHSIFNLCRTAVSNSGILKLQILSWNVLVM